MQTWALAHMLLVSAFWGLREARLVRLDVERRFLLYISRHTYVKVTLLGQAELPGLEGQILAAMHQNPYEWRLNAQMREKTLRRLEAEGKHEAVTQMRQRNENRQRRIEEHLYVERVVPHWFSGRYTDPAIHVIEAMRDNAVSLGYIDADETEGKGLLSIRSTKSVFRPHCDTIAGLKESFEETLGRWYDFQKREANLYEQLSQQCRQGMRNVIMSVHG